MTSKILEVIQLLEHAIGPSRKLDQAIGIALEILPTKPFESDAPCERLEGMYWVFGRKDTPNGPVEERWSRNPPFYTFMLDARIHGEDIIGSSEQKQIEGQPVFWVAVHRMPKGKMSIAGRGRSEALARRIAALKAINSK